MQELPDSVRWQKRNHRGEETQVKGTKVFNKIIEESPPNIRKEKWLSGCICITPVRQGQKRNPPCHIVKHWCTEQDRTLKTSREKQAAYKSKPVRTTDFSVKILKARRAWTDDLRCQPRLLDPTTLSAVLEGENNHNNSRRKECVSTEPPLGQTLWSTKRMKTSKRTQAYINSLRTIGQKI